MRQLPCFRELDKNRYIIWSDTGPHFRCAEFMHYLFVELALLDKKVSFNLFCEKHGKNTRDQHFSKVSYFLKQESMVKKLCTSQDICDAIEKQQEIANINNACLKSSQKATSTLEYKQVQTKAFVVPEHQQTNIVSNILKIPNLKNYYNLYTDDNTFILKTHFMSDQTEFDIILPGPILKTKNTRIEMNEKRDKIYPVIVNSSYISRKMTTWRIMHRRERNFINQSQVTSDNMVPEHRESNVLSLAHNHCKAKCLTCQSVCKYRLSELNLSNPNLTHDEIKNELFNHLHPKSRLNKRERTNRSYDQAKVELANHYKKCHFISLP